MAIEQHPANKLVNQTIIRLIIIKGNTSILMKNTICGWMTPSSYLTSNQTILKVLNNIADSYGMEISKPRLAGLFMCRYKFKPTIDIQQYYIAYYKNGELKTLGEKENVKWINRKKVVDKLGITVPALSRQICQILQYPQTIWGGSFIIDKVNDKFNSEIEEPFYPLDSTS